MAKRKGERRRISTVGDTEGEKGLKRRGRGVERLQCRLNQPLFLKVTNAIL